MTQNLQKLANDIEEKVAQLEQRTADAERRKAQAESIANSLEERNRQQITAAEAEVKVYKKKLLQQANDDISQLKSEIPKLQSVKQQLIDEVEDLAIKQTVIVGQQDDLETEHGALVTGIEQLQTKLSSLDSELVEAQDILNDRQGKVGVLKEQIKELNYTIDQMAGDKDALQTELNNLGNDIAELASDFTSQKQYKENELYELNSKIRKAQISLQEAEVQDKAMRSQWAEEKLKLDKRTEVVQRMESRLSDAESRIEELNRFGTL